MEANLGKNKSKYPPPPDILHSGVAQAEWIRVMAELRLHDEYKSVDEAVLTAYCHMVGMWHRATAELDNGQLCITDERGRVVKNPLVAVISQCATQIASMGMKLGVTPSGRKKMGRGARPLSPIEELGGVPK